MELILYRISWIINYAYTSVFIWLAIIVFGRHHGSTDQNVVRKREVKWWHKAMYNMKLLCCIYERLFLWRLFYFYLFPSCWKKMELLYISNDWRCNNWLRLLEKYLSTLLPSILYAVTIFSVSIFFLLTCFDWWWPCHYLSNS
jgi:hypothetical protein